ncbi:MAG: PKD domain-containing protein [Bacteroidetes bacterium]|nr:PKD domain-containing protein [Bacteroidota bacterium]
MKTKITLLAILLMAGFMAKAQIPCNPNFTYTIDPSGIVSFTGTVTTSATSYNWNFGNGTSGVGLNTTAFYNAPGTYTVCLIVQDSSLVPNCIDSSCVTITITSSSGSSCNAAFYVYPDTSAGASPHTYIGVNASTGAGLTYTWVWGDGTPNSSGPYPSHTYSVAGIYNVCLVVISSTCLDSFCSNQTINKTSSDPYTINFQAPAGINSVNKELAEIYPNPADDKLFIKGDEHTIYQADMYTLSGNLLASFTSKGNQAIDISKLPAQLYMVKISDASGKAQFAKFMKK